LLGEDVYLGLNKAERLTYGDSMMTHAMVFTGVTNDVCVVENLSCRVSISNDDFRLMESL
jgi:aminopeptidase C